MFVASEEATPGSVMQNAERISPASSGLSQCSFCAADPYFTSTSMLPVSGALQLKPPGANDDRPMISATGAYSTLVSPAPYSPSEIAPGRKRFHKPAARASAFSVFINASWFPLFPLGGFLH